MISGYLIKELIYKGKNTLLFRGEREDDNRCVILKKLKPEFLLPFFKARLKHEFDVTRSLDIDEILPVIGLEQMDSDPVLILEDFGGISISQLIRTKLLNTGFIIKTAIQSITVIEKLHYLNIIHKNINSRNLIINQNEGTIKITDLGISSRLLNETQVIVNPQVLEGSLPYISPEQTARMNRGIDYRTDFYSFGVTLFEILTKSLPFTTDDPMELIHCHIARTPKAPHLIDQRIPRVLSDIVMKLMSKAPEDRYQSAFGIKHDLESCLTQWQQSGVINPFPLGEKDNLSRFNIPQVLYGRKEETDELLSAFETVCQGNVKLMFVTGAPGIGKTAIINEIQKSIVRQRGYFISGKFDQLKGNVPYAAIISSFQELVRQILTENEDQVKR